MANLTVSTDIDSFMQSADKVAARTSLGVPSSTTTISAGTGLTGGGDLSANRTLSVSSDVVVRDSNQNITANSLIEGFSNITASGTQVVLTVASAPSYLVTGSGGQTIKLPDATTLQNGVVYLFNNNQSSGSILVNNNSNTLIATIPSGGFSAVSLLSNSIAAGSWERHEQAPSNVTWSTNTLDYPGSITNATWNGVAVAVNRGGTGASTQQAAINALAGATTSGQFLRGNGTNVAMSAIQAGDVPTLNQNTTGTASNVTGTVAIANGGTASTTAQAAISSLGVGMRMVEAQTAGVIGATMVGNVLTVTSTGVFTADSYTIALGDIIAFTLQADTKQNGFWEATTLGAVGVQPVFTRPAWFTGTARNGMYMTRFGASQSGYVMAFFNTTANADITVGTSQITVIRVSYRTANAITGFNQFTGRQSFLANSTTNVPFQFQAGAALVTTPVAHYVEWFNDQMYLTNAAGVRTTNTNHVAIPATATSSGQVGQIAVDNAGSWLYVCTATNVWKRVLLTTF